MAEESIAKKALNEWQKELAEKDKQIEDLEAQIEKMKYALKKIIETVQNDNISGYGERLVKIYDIIYEVL